MTPQTGEKSFQAGIIDLVRLTGWRHFAVRDSRGCPPGWPDLVLVHPDRGVLYRESKSDGGRLSVEQEAWGELLERAGCDWAIWRPRDWSTIEAQLRGQLANGGGERVLG
jgi:hypothetical protein